MTTQNKLTRDELLDEIPRLADELGTTPTTSDMNEHGQYSVAPYYRVFGSWPAALRAAGFEAPPTREERSPTELLTEIRRLADGDDPPSSTKMDTDGAYASETCRLEFGSWTAALREAGFTPPTNGTRISDAELCNALVDLADELDTAPTSKDMRESGPYSPGSYINRFGSWDDALAAAGLDPDDMTHSASTEMLIDALQQLADNLDHPPLARDMNESGPYHASTYYRRFGSWATALEKADVEPENESQSQEDEPTSGASPVHNKLDRETLLAELHRLANKKEDSSPPTTSMMQKEGEYSPGTYINRFGSWTKALEAAGLSRSE